MATEDEEFEFRLRAEREAAMRPAGAPVPVAPPPAAPPRREVGFVESAGRTAAASTIPVVKMFGLAAATAARLFGQKAQDKVFAAMDRVTGRMEQEYRPQAGEEFSTAGQIAGGIASMPVEVAGGFGLQHGVERAQGVVQRGGSMGEAGRAGAVTGAVRVGMNALPVKVGGAVGRVVENAAGRVIGGGLTGAGLVGVTGVAGRAAENAALPEGEQFADMRQDVTPSAAELGLGAAFGAVPGALAAAKTLRGAAETPVRDLPRQVPQAENPKGGLAKRAVQPNPALLETVPAAEKAGLTVLPHHVAEGEAVRALGTAAGGDVYKQNTKAFTKALIKELDPDETAARLDTKTFHRVLDKQGKTIGENMAKYDMPVDDALRARLESISKDAADNADADTGRMTMNRVREILGKAEAGEGSIAGQAVRELDTAIGRQIRSNTKNQDLVARLRAVQDVLRDTAERQMAPDEAKAVQQARRRYAYAMEILPDIDDFGRTGYYEPGQLWKRLTGSEAGRQRVASERGGLTDLAKAGALVADRSGTGHGYVSVGSNSVGVGASGMRAYASPSRIAEVAIGAIGGKKAYNRFGPGLVKRLAAEHDAELARAAQVPEPPPLELAAPDAPMPQGPRPDVRGEAPAEVPEWTTTAGVDAQKPGSQIPAIEPEGLLPAVGDDIPPARINPEPRGRVPDIPAVPGRPDMPDVMVAGGPREVAATEATGRAMQAPGAALAREQQGFAPKKPEPPTGGGGTPPIDPRLAKIAELRRQAPSQAVKKVLDAREAEIKKVIKRETDIAELEAAAQATDDVDLRQSLLAEANKLRGGKLPVGEVTEGMPDLPKPKTEKIPVGKVIEGQPDLPVGKTEKIPVGEATEITPEVVEPAPERIPVGEATEMPEPLPVGEVVEDPIPVGDAMEFEQMPVGEATEITPEVVEPKAAATESRKDKAEASFKRRYGEGYKAAAEERRALEEEIVNSFPTYQAGGEVVTPVIEAVERAWGRRRITMNPEGFERAVVEALRPVAERRKEWKTREKARDNDRRIKNQLAAYEKSVRDAQQDAMGELRTLERQGRLSQDEIEDLNRRIQKSETMDDAVDEMDAIIMKKNQSSGTSVARRESAANEPAQVVPEATNVDNAPTAPAGGGRSKGMEQTKGVSRQQLLDAQDAEIAKSQRQFDEERVAIEKELGQLQSKLSNIRNKGEKRDALNERARAARLAHEARVREVLAEFRPKIDNHPEELARREASRVAARQRQQENTRTDPQPAPTGPAGGGRSEGMEQTKGVAGYSAEKPAWEAVKARTSAAAEALKKYPKLPNGATPDDVKSTAAWRKDYAEYEQAFANERAWNARMLRRYGDEIRAERASEREAKLSAVQQENTRTDPQPAPTAPAGGVEQTKITHAGMEIEEIPAQGGEPTRWQVTVPETGERVSTPSGLDAAKRIAENERKVIERSGTLAQRMKAAEEANAAEEQARAEAKKARSVATAGKSLAEIKAMDHMNRTIRVDGKDMKAHEFVDARLAAGDIPKIEMVDRVAPMSRTAFNRAPNAEQRAHEAKVKAGGKKETYWLGGYGLSKTEYDYAVKKAAAQQENTRAPQEVTQQAEPQGRGAAETGDRAQRAAEGGGQAQEPDALSLTPKQYHEAKLRRMADENGASMSEVREMYDTEAGRAENVQEWVGAVMAAAKAGKPVSRATLDKLEEVRPRAVGQLMHDYPHAKLPEGYQVPDARKVEAEESAARRANRAAAKKEGMKPAALSDSRKATKGALERAGYVVQDLDIGMKLQSRGDLRVSLKAIPRDIDVVISLKNGKWKFSDVLSEAPSSISQAEAVTEFRKLVDGSSVADRPAAEPTRPAPVPRPAPRTEAPAAKPTGKSLTPAEVKTEFQRQIDAVPRFGDGGPETITLKAGGSTARIQNTARRVAEYMKALDTVKGGKTPKPVPEKTDKRPSGLVSWGGDLSKRAPITTIKDMIDDLDPQAAVDFAAAQGIDLEVALKDDRKRLDQVRGLKPTPEPQEPTSGSNFLEEMYGEQPAAPTERPKLFGDVDRKRVPVAYRDPNTGGTWSGRGLKPKWLQDALAEGRSLESFEAGKVPAKGQIEGVQLADAHRKSVPFGTVFSYSALGKQKQKLAYELEKLGVPKARAAQIVQDAATMTPGDRGARFLSLAEVRRAAESAGVLFTP